MELMQAIILGGIQGLTEFFPVSSSGHLVICQQMMGLKEPILLFDISVHVGTLAAIVIYFFNDIISIFKSLVRSVSFRLRGQGGQFSNAETNDIKMAWLIVAGSLPTAVIGFGFHMISHVLFSSMIIVGVSLLITGGVLLGTRWINQEKESGSDLSIKQALLIGTVQGLAVIPGISRSGATISAGLFLGVNRDIAIRYSFLLSIPAILGALVLQISTDSSGAGNVSLGIIATGLVTSLIIGYASLSVLVKMVQKGHLYFFTPYCVVLGGVVLIAGG
ncbi:MAG: undecaprenyl-diphosphate phosphatase [Desulfobacteraceae bacterium]|nr:undecaprenyl-diphosphate phosphatase [Desulfobacteraceae bacterium]MBC2754959.1 undecaprenyl-diphosphate phosphatase [Desulfobacteraceae bacterium]